MTAVKKHQTAAKKKSPEKPKQQNVNTSPGNPPVTVKQRTVVTPWRDTVEFNKTYNGLFGTPSRPADRRKALSNIRIWSLRRANLCPAAVLATSALVQAQLKDKPDNDGIQTTYAMAFTRFYNFMSSIIQGHNMSSMYETAQELGLQSFIVDLRHLCAHGQELPPVEVLRSTSNHCLEWLRTYYWLPHKETMSNLDAGKLQRKDKLMFKKELSSLLELYDLTLECHLKGADKLKAIRKLKSSAEFNKIRVYSSSKKGKTSKEMLGSLLNDLSLKIKKDSSSMKDLVDTYMGCLLNMKYFLGSGLEIGDNEDVLIAGTQDLFRVLAMQGYIESFFVALVRLAENPNESDVRRFGACYWATKMITTFSMLFRMKRMYKEELDLDNKLKPVDFSSLNTNVHSKTMRSLLLHSGVDSSVTLIFGDNPKKAKTWIFDRDFIMQRVPSFSKYSGPILKGLLPLADPPYSPSQINTLLQVCDVRLNVVKELEESEPMQVDSPSEESYYLKALENLVSARSKGNTMSSGAALNLGIWTIENDNDWSKCALGVLPWDQ